MSNPPAIQTYYVTLIKAEGPWRSHPPTPHDIAEVISEDYAGRFAVTVTAIGGDSATVEQKS